MTARYLSAPIAPGLIKPVGIVHCRKINVGEQCTRTTPAGTLAFDGEREIELFAGDRVDIALDRLGPRSVDVNRTVEMLGHLGVLEQSRTID